jgi:hypothetical protein
MRDVHLSLKGTLSSLYAPEIQLSGSLSTTKSCRIGVKGTICGSELCIIQADNCTPDRQGQTFYVEDATRGFTLIIAWRDKEIKPPPVLGWRGLKSLFEGLYPFDSQVFNLCFYGIDCNLTTSIHIEIPHNLTRYTIDTRNLQHVFSERMLKAPSYMGGIAAQGEAFQMHLHYKSLDAFRRISTPAITMIWVLLLDLAVMELGKGEISWRDKPSAVLGFLSINASAFAGLAAIRVGSTLRSLLNFVRLVAVAWVLSLTVAIRAQSLPFSTEHIGAFVDAGLKLAIVWLCITGVFSFIPYALLHDSRRRSFWFMALTILGLIGWVALCFFSAHFEVANSFASLVNK